MNKKKLLFHLFLLTIFLQTIPNLNLVGSDNVLFTTNFLSLFLVALLGARVLFTPTYYNLRIKHDHERLLILIFLMFQAFSVINVINLYAFLVMLVNVTAGVLMYFIAKSIIFEGSKTDHQTQSYLINKTIVLGGVLNMAFQLSLLIFPTGTMQIINNLFSKNLMAVTTFHYYVNSKLYSNFPLEILTPILFLNLLTNRRIIKRIVSYIFLIVILVLAFMSNFRYRFAGFFVSVVSSMILFKSFLGSVHKHVLLYSILLGFIIFNLLAYFHNSTIINRFIDTEEYGQHGTIAFRFNMFGTAFDLGTSRLLGVGLGNMYDYLHKTPSAQTALDKQSTRYSLMGGAHNIFFQTFAETGFFGLFSLVILIIFWLIKDVQLLGKKVLKEKKVYMLMFWTLLFMNQFIPAYNTTFYFFFFLLRGLI